MVLGKLIIYILKNETRSSFILNYITCKWVKDFNVRAETSRLLEKNKPGKPLKRMKMFLK